MYAIFLLIKNKNNFLYKGKCASSVEVIVDELTSPTSIRSKSSSMMLSFNRRPNLRTCETSVSEAKIKSMVNILKNGQRFGFNDDLVVYLNSRVIKHFQISKKGYFINTILILIINKQTNTSAKRRLYFIESRLWIHRPRSSDTSARWRIPICTQWI